VQLDYHYTTRCIIRRDSNCINTPFDTVSATPLVAPACIFLLSFDPLVPPNDTQASKHGVAAGRAAAGGSVGRGGHLDGGAARHGGREHQPRGGGGVWRRVRGDAPAAAAAAHQSHPAAAAGARADGGPGVLSRAAPGWRHAWLTPNRPHPH